MSATDASISIRSQAESELGKQIPAKEAAMQIWQPIETAPKDGTMILVCEENETGFWEYEQTSWSPTWGFGGGSVTNNPKHWMLLPAPPSNSLHHDPAKQEGLPHVECPTCGQPAVDFEALENTNNGPATTCFCASDKLELIPPVIEGISMLLASAAEAGALPCEETLRPVFWHLADQARELRLALREVGKA